MWMEKNKIHRDTKEGLSPQLPALLAGLTASYACWHYFPEGFKGSVILIFSLLPFQTAQLFIRRDIKTAHTAEVFLNTHQDREAKVRKYYMQQIEGDARTQVSPRDKGVLSFLKISKLKDKDRANIED